MIYKLMEKKHNELIEYVAEYFGVQNKRKNIPKT